MKILLTVHLFFPDFTAGTEVLTRSVARELLARGHEVHVLTAYPGGRELKDTERFDEYDFEGIHVYRFHHAYAPMAGQKSLVELTYDNHLATSYFKSILEKFNPKIVHFFHLNRLGTGLIDAAIETGIPAFMTPTDFWMICIAGHLSLSDGSMCQGPSAYAGNCVKHLIQMTQRGVVGKAAGWLPAACAEMLARLTSAGVLPPYPYWNEVKALGIRLGINIASLNKLSGIVSPSKVISDVLLRHGVSPHLIIQAAFGIEMPANELPARRPLPRKPFRVGFIGTLARHKGSHVLIDAFKTLPSGQAVLKIFGDMEQYPEYARKLRKLAGNNRAIEFCGTFPNSKISEIMVDLDVLVVPSVWYENTPLVIYSAQAARCPVVASDFPGLSDVIEDEVNGLLFEAGNVGALAGQLSRLIEEPGLAVRLSSNSRRPKPIAAYVDELLGIWGAL